MKKKDVYWVRRTHLFRRDEYICSACRTVCGEPYARCPGCGAEIRKTKKDATWILEAEILSDIMDDDW